MFLIAPAANVTGGVLTSLSGVTLSVSNVITAAGGTYYAFATADASSSFTPTGSNTTPGPTVISGASDQFLIVPDANFNAGNEITTLSGVFVTTSTTVTGLLSGVAYRSVLLTPSSAIINTVTVPDAFTGSQWSVADAAAGGILRFTISGTPYNGGSALTNIYIYENGSSTPIPTGLTAPGTFDLTSRTNGVSYSYKIAAVNAAGVGPQSAAAKTATPTSATGPTVVNLFPAAGAAGVAVDGTITLTWSEPVLAGTGSIVIRNVTTGTVIETLTLPGAISAGSPPPAGKVYVNGSQTVIKPTTDLPNGTTVSFRPGLNFVKSLSGTPSVAIATDALYFATASASGASLWGHTLSTNYGTSGSMFVDQANGNDANSGLTFATAKRTISAAMTAMASGVGGKIKVASGTYNETITVKGGASGNPLVIEPYGTASPIVTCAEPMTTGWTLCNSGDAAVIGPNYASIYKKTGIPVTTFTRSDPMNANLFAGSTRLNIARKYKYGQNTTAWCRSLDLLTADSTVVVGGEITAYRHAALLAEFTATQLQKSVMICQESPNVVSFRRCTVSGADIIPTNTVTEDGSTDVGWHMNFGMFNLLPAMEQGGWGYDWDGVTANCDLYVWLPLGKTTADISYSARMNAFTSSASNFTIRGLTIERFSGSAKSFENTSGTVLSQDFGCALACGGTGTTRTNITMENNWLRNGWSNGLVPARHCGAISIAGCTGVTIRHNTIEDIQAMEGQTITNCNNVLSEWNKNDGNLVEDFWPRGSDKVVYAHNLHTGSRLGHTHANAVPFYVVNEGLEWGNIWKNATSFGTWQDALNIQFAFNFWDWVSAYWAIKDQNGAFKPGAVLTAGGMMLNNTIAYSANRLYPTNQSIILTEPAGHPFILKNNIYYISNLGTSTITANGGNLNTATTGNFPAGPGNTSEPVTTTFPGRASNDYSIGPASVVRSSLGQSIASEIASLAATYPFFTDFTDAFGQAINTSAPKRGAMTNLDVNPMTAT